MKDIAAELLENIQKDFDEKIHYRKTIKALYEKVKEGTADYNDAQNFAKETGKILAKVFQSNLSSDVLPDGRMYYNIANRIIPEMLKLDHELVSEVSTGVINKINESAGIGIKARKPKLNEEKVKGIVDIVSGKAKFDKIAYMLKDPVINFSQCIVDDTVRENADFQYKSGLNPKIIRTTTGKCCKWCNSMAGVYPYEDAKKNPDVFRRHKHCDCKVEYLPGDGRRQNVHTKKWSRELKKELIPIESKKVKEYNKYPVETLKREHKNSVDSGMISALCTFENYYNLYVEIEERIIGKYTGNGILIKSQSKHFIERVIGTGVDPKIYKEELIKVNRNGVAINDICDALFNGNPRPCKHTSRGISQVFEGKKCNVSMNPDNGNLIQCNPRRAKNGKV